MVSGRTGGALRVAVSSALAALVLALGAALVWAAGPGPNPNGPVDRSRAAQAYTWNELLSGLGAVPDTQLLAENNDATVEGPAVNASPTPTPSVQTTPTPAPKDGMDVKYGADGGEITVKPTRGGTSLISVDTAPSGGVLYRPVNGPITSSFGLRFHPVLRVWKLHTGTDFGVGCGSPVGAAAKGTVVFTGWGGGNGWRIVVDHGVINGHRVQTSYNHLSVIGVRVGYKVVAHQMLAKSGTTGYSTGCHLHFEVMVDGRFADPMPWLTGKPSAVRPAPLPNLTPKLPPGEKLNTKPDEHSDVGTDAPDPTATPTPTPSATPTPTPSGTPTPTPSVDPSATPSGTPEPSATPSGTPDPSTTPGPTASPSGTPTPSGTPSPTPSTTPTPTPSTTPSPTPSRTPSKPPASGSVTPSSSPKPTSASQTPSTESSAGS